MTSIKKKNQHPRILITGATGQISRCLVNKYLANRANLTLIGRDKKRLAEQFPEHIVGDYGDISKLSQGCDIILHTAVLNNNVSASNDLYKDVNVDLALQVAKSAPKTSRMIFLSTFHVLDPKNQSSYARSKRLMEAKLSVFENAQILYLPFVYDDDMNTRISFVKKIPNPLGKVVKNLIWSVKPMVHCSKIAEHIFAKKPSENRCFLADNQSLNPAYIFLKGAFDLSFAGAIFILFWWLLLLTFVGIRLTSRGPGIFQQLRIGRQSKDFVCYKFRTMALGTPQKGTHEVESSAVTSLGRILRKSKIDELPQIFNILKNEMSLVGPRPGLPSQPDLKHQRSERGVFNVKPGITGLAQVLKIDMSDPPKLAKVDQEYIARRSLPFDLQICIATVTNGFGDNVKKTTGA